MRAGLRGEMAARAEGRPSFSLPSRSTPCWAVPKSCRTWPHRSTAAFPRRADQITIACLRTAVQAHPARGGPASTFHVTDLPVGRISRRCLFACYLGLTRPSLAIRLCQFRTGRPAAVDQNTRTTRPMAAQDQRFSDLERSLADAARLIGESKREIKRSQGLLQDQEFRTGAAANPGPRGSDDGDRGSVVRERS